MVALDIAHLFGKDDQDLDLEARHVESGLGVGCSEPALCRLYPLGASHSPPWLVGTAVERHTNCTYEHNLEQDR